MELDPPRQLVHPVRLHGDAIALASSVAPSGRVVGVLVPLEDQVAVLVLGQEPSCPASAVGRNGSKPTSFTGDFTTGRPRARASSRDPRQIEVRHAARPPRACTRGPSPGTGNGRSGPRSPSRRRSRPPRRHPAAAALLRRVSCSRSGRRTRPTRARRGRRRGSRTRRCGQRKHRLHGARVYGARHRGWGPGTAAATGTGRRSRAVGRPPPMHRRPVAPPASGSTIVMTTDDPRYRVLNRYMLLSLATALATMGIKGLAAAITGSVDSSDALESLVNLTAAINRADRAPGGRASRRSQRLRARRGRVHLGRGRGRDGVPGRRRDRLDLGTAPDEPRSARPARPRDGAVDGGGRDEPRRRARADPRRSPSSSHRARGGQEAPAHRCRGRPRACWWA